MSAPDADLGQHLLRDARAVARVVRAAKLQPGETVLDAGAGTGALTRAIADAVGSQGRVWAVEVDPAMIAKLDADLPEHVTILEEDLLDVALPPGLDAVVANPPFKIAAPLVERIVAARVPRSVLVLPRELADRLTAAPGTERYGKLTVRVQVQATVEDFGFLPRRVFDPPPGVACGIVRIRPHARADDVDLATLQQVLDVAWPAWTRKAKQAFFPLAAQFRADAAGLTQMLRDAGWADERVNTLPPSAFAAVAAHLREHGRAQP